MLIEELTGHATETDMQIGRADKQLEGSCYQVFEPTVVPQLLSAQDYLALRPTQLQLFHQVPCLVLGQKPYLGIFRRDGEGGKEVITG